MREKLLCFIHSSYLCSRRQKMQSIMKKKTYIIIAFCTLLTTEASAQQQVSFGPLHSPDSPPKNGCCLAIRFTRQENL